MTALAAFLVSHTWAAMAAALGGFLLLFGGLELYARATTTPAEVTRKFFHAGSGLLTLSFPFLFHDVWPVLVLTGASALLVTAVKFLPFVGARLGHVANRVERPTLGEVYFPVSVGLLFWLTRHDDPLLFVIPVLMLTLADATCALVGGRYGMTRYLGASKSLEGSIAFVVVAFFCVHVPLLVWSGVGRIESLLVAATLALLVMLLEGSAWRGLDNLFIPIGGYFLLRVYVTLDAPALLSRLLVTIALVVFIVFTRERTTLEDDSLVAGAFLCYVAWALMGWRWLVGPLSIAVGYRWLSPATTDNSRRIHDVPAVLSVWAAAIGWLTLARVSGEPALLYPYTIVFGAHLAMFGTSRLGSQYPQTSLARLFCRAVLTSWAIVAIPLLAVTGVTAANLAAAVGSIAAIALGAAIFIGMQREVRDAPQTTRRWICQACGALVASAATWAVAIAVSRTLS